MRIIHALPATLLLLMATQGLRAQQDPNAEPYLQAVSEQFQMDKSYTLHMDYIRKDIMRETSAEGEGDIWMKGLKYKILVDEYEVSFDGDKLYSHNKEDGEVYISVPEPDDPGYLQAVPIKIIKAYQHDFKYRLIGSKPFYGRDRIEIQLYPNSPSGPYSMLKIFVNPGTLRLEAFQLKHKEGIEYTMFLTDVKEVPGLDDGMFRFDPAKYPDTDIIELLD